MRLEDTPPTESPAAMAPLPDDAAILRGRLEAVRGRMGTGQRRAHGSNISCSSTQFRTIAPDSSTRRADRAQAMNLELQALRAQLPPPTSIAAAAVEVLAVGVAWAVAAMGPGGVWAAVCRAVGR